MKRKRSSLKKIKNKSESSEDDSSNNSKKSEESSNTKVENTRGKRPRQRQENSLGELTKNFIRYIKERGENVVNINDVVKKLKVKKRRIYDITNVLEGKL